ncbi:MAG: class I tRNA ligase family protein [bacterium]
MAEKEEKSKSDSALREERVLEFWKENKIFEKSLKQTEGGEEFVFYEGPPTANGKPGIHHLEARAFKDAIPRYKTMQGFHVRRKGGWDTHGLPVELQVEKKLGLNSKKAIEEYGIAKFNKECKESVWEYLDVWNKFTKRVGYWVDQENPYVTYHNDYIESVWNVVKKANEQKLLYKDYKVVPWCPRCGTALSSHELAQGYEDVKDLSVYIKFKAKVKSDSNVYMVAWTTTPWTLPGNVALAVGKDITYLWLKKDNEILIVAEDKKDILGEGYEIVDKRFGEQLIGLEYEPLFPYLSNTISGSEKVKLDKAFKIYNADFVNTEDGTGIVHTAVMYGQDDFMLGTEVGLPKHHLVGLDGKFLAGTGFLEGRFVKEVDQNGKPTLAVDIIDDLKKRNLFFKQESYKHSYPHCWRCKTALIYYARDSWYIKVSDPKIKDEMIAENKKINWEPAHIRDGRFGEWLKDIKDWAISRERYWGTPLPVWQCADCNKIDVVGSVAELKEKTIKSGNKYFIMRHGGSEGNLKGLVSCNIKNVDHLTEDGRNQVLKSVKDLKNKKIDLIISSDFARTKETAEIAKKEFGLSDDKLIFDEKLRELCVGVFEGKRWQEYHDFIKEKDWYHYVPEDGESYKEVKLRMADFIYGAEKKFKDKNILIVTHEGPARTLFASVEGMNEVETMEHLKNEIQSFDNAQIVEIDFVPLPHNENYELDLHKPYIDELNFICKCGGKLIRVKEVMDVWFDSGAMPFAQDHYPFENKKWVEGKGYPADYICEAVDQTRGWFYTLHAIGVIMGRGRAFKNVICLGHLLDASGKKMSKSLGNIVDPWIMIEKYGVDTLRLWMYSVNQPGESKNFDEKTVALLSNQVFSLLYNVLAFYELYRDRSLEDISHKPKTDDVLDQWILARLDELVKLTTENFDNYKLLEPTRGLRDFVGDLSTWYLRRSRDRIKEGDQESKKTLYFVLKTLAKIMAPLAPFTAEDIWLKLKNEKDVESVHLTEWPKMSKGILDIFGHKEKNILKNMQTVRDVVTLGLEARQKAGIKVRQPLAMLTLKDIDHEIDWAFIELIKDELNVKEVVIDTNISNKVVLDIKITPELKQEGYYRELVRAIQDMRKKMGLTPSDKISIVFDTNDAGQKLIKKFEIEMKKTVLVTQIDFDKNDGTEIKIDELVFKIKIEKI